MYFTDRYTQAEGGRETETKTRIEKEKERDEQTAAM